MTFNRRSFLKGSFTTIAATGLLLAAEKKALLQSVEHLVPGDNTDDEQYWAMVKKHFSLEPGLTYFNNASLGPSPELVIDATDSFRRKLESFPSKYMWGGWNGEKENVRSRVAALFNVSPDEIALNHNTTEGLNLVAASLDLGPGDEVIIGDHEHQTGVIPWKHFLEARGVTIVRPTLPILPETPGQLVDVYTQAMTAKTRAILMCHMVNTNGMILPVREVSEIARERGILVCVDGAQTPGMIRVDLKKLGCDFFATSAHKWLWAPKGMGVFYARADRQDLLKPLIVSGMYYTDKTCRRFENYNTRNLPELLGLGTAVDFNAFVGTRAIEKRVYLLKHYLRRRLEELPWMTVKTPGPDDLSAGITVAEMTGRSAADVSKILDEKYGLNLRPMMSHDLNALRISTAAYILKEDIDYLINSLTEIHGKEG